MKKIMFSGILTVALILASQVAHSLSLEIFSFTGTITSTSFDPSVHYYDSGISPEVGDRFTGSLTYLFDPSVADYSIYNPDSTFSRYWDHVEYSYFLQFEEFTIHPSVPKLIDINNGIDSDYMAFKAAEGATHFSSTGEEIDTFGFYFWSSTGTAFDGNGVPTTIDSSAFDNSTLSFYFLKGVNYLNSQDPVFMTSYTGRLDMLNTQSIQLPLPTPEPATIVLLCLGLAGILGSRFKIHNPLKK